MSQKREELLGIKNKKFENFSEWFSEVIEKCELADLRYGVQGFIVHRPWSMWVIKYIYRFFEEELEKTGHKPVLFPLVIPEENLKKEREHIGFLPQVFWVTEAGERKLEKKLALRPTSETAFYSVYPFWIKSYKDLPLKLYQSVAVYRYEHVTRPFIRGREFLWIETHNVFSTHEEALAQTREDMEISKKVIWEKLGIPFLNFKRPPWDKFKGAEDTYATDTLLPDGKAFQIASTHDLGQRFSKVFEIKFMDKDKKWKLAWQTCFGPGIWRIFAALVAIHGDDKGLVYLFDVSPIQIIIIPIYYSKEEREKVLKKCKELKEKLGEFRVKIDDSEKTPGEKFNIWEMFGVPIRLEIGKEEVEKKEVTIFRRDNFERIKVKESKLKEKILEIKDDMLRNLKERAKKFFEERISKATNKEEILKILREKGGFIEIPFCGREECAMEIKEETNGLEVRGILIKDGKEFKGDLKGKKCAWCGERAKEIVYLAKPY